MDKNERARKWRNSPIIEGSARDLRHISKDEAEYRQYLWEIWKIKPSKKAVAELEKRINEVLTKLGVDTTKDDESIKAQMDFLNIFVHSIDETQAKSAAGIYISAYVRGGMKPYAYIAGAKVRGNEYTFPITYWEKQKLVEEWVT